MLRDHCQLVRSGIFLVLVLQKQKCVLASRTSPPPRLPVISEVLNTPRQHGSNPKRSFGLAWQRYGSFCKKAAARQPKKC
jgi:hypothetical protein